MNIQNLLSQMMTSNNPMQMMMGMLNPQQKQAANLFQNKNNNEQAQIVADMCNKNGISKEQLSQIINAIKK